MFRIEVIVGTDVVMVVTMWAFVATSQQWRSPRWRQSFGPRRAYLGWRAFVQSGESWAVGSRLSGAGRRSTAAQRGHPLQSTLVEIEKAVRRNGSCRDQATLATAIRRHARPWRQHWERAMAIS